jgi:hypothetical protein
MASPAWSDAQKVVGVTYSPDGHLVDGASHWLVVDDHRPGGPTLGAEDTFGSSGPLLGGIPDSIVARSAVRSMPREKQDRSRVAGWMFQRPRMSLNPFLTCSNS